MRYQHKKKRSAHSRASGNPESQIEYLSLNALDPRFRGGERNRLRHAVLISLLVISHVAVILGTMMMVLDAVHHW
jgi:hypothetical protein